MVSQGSYMVLSTTNIVCKLVGHNSTTTIMPTIMAKISEG